MGYSIKILSNSEFDRLPYRYSQQAMGIADVGRSSVYVRNTHIHDLNKYLLDHELNHLVEKHATDDIDGIRYKITSSLFSGIKSLAGKAIPAISSFAKKYTPAATSAFTGLGSSLGRGISVPAGQPNFLSPSQHAAQNAMNFPFSQFIPGVGQSISNLGQVFAQRQPQPQPPIQQNGGGNGFFNSLSSGFASGLGQKEGENILETFGRGIGTTAGETLGMAGNPQTILGTGLLTAGLNSPLPKVPELPQSILDIQQQVRAGGSPLQQFSTQKLTDLLGQNFDPLSEPEIQAALREAERSYEQKVRSTKQIFRSVRPGSSPDTDTAFSKALNEDYDTYSRIKSDILANRTRELKNNFDSKRLAQIQQAFGISNQDLQQRLIAADFDLQKLYQQLQFDYAGALYKKQTLGGIGAELIGRGQTLSSIKQLQNNPNILLQI